MPKTAQKQQQRIEAIRTFNRFYVPRMGFLNRNWTSMMSLSEARVIHEIYIRQGITARDISRLISIDKGYLSRVLLKFERNGYIIKKKVPHDARQRLLVITTKGRRSYDAWAKIAQSNVASVLSNMTEEQQQEMTEALMRVMNLIQDADSRVPGGQVLIRAGL